MSKKTKQLRKQAKNEKKAVKKARKGRPKGRYVECPTKVSICHVAALSADAASEPKSLDAADCFAHCHFWLGRRASFSAGRTRARGAPHRAGD